MRSSVANSSRVSSVRKISDGKLVALALLLVVNKAYQFIPTRYQ
jgi:hypothetical protein